MAMEDQAIDEAITTTRSTTTDEKVEVDLEKVKAEVDKPKAELTNGAGASTSDGAGKMRNLELHIRSGGPINIDGYMGGGKSTFMPHLKRRGYRLVDSLKSLLARAVYPDWDAFDESQKTDVYGVMLKPEAECINALINLVAEKRGDSNQKLAIEANLGYRAPPFFNIYFMVKRPDVISGERKYGKDPSQHFLDTDSRLQSDFGKDNVLVVKDEADLNQLMRLISGEA